MRVGIVSQFGYDNMGNKLQNYAVQQILLQYVDKTTIIRNQAWNPNIFVRIKRKPSIHELPWLNKILGKRRKCEILKFHKKLLSTGSGSYYYDRDQVNIKENDICDLYCAGSDQIWNPYDGRSGMFNYLGFADRDATFSYAASFGIDKIPEEYVEDVRKGLQHIKFISVREDAGKRIVEELTGRTDVQVLVDPTMLLTTQEWDRVASKPKRKVPKRYVLTYFLGTVSPERKQEVYRKAEEMDCQVIELMDKNSPFYVSGPGEFVYLIKNAQFVCTDSFHGSVFSFLYGRPLAIFDREGNGSDMSSRLVTLSEKFHLQECLVRDNHIPSIQNVDYSDGYAVLEEERKKSKAFLDMVFQEAERIGLCR